MTAPAVAFPIGAQLKSARVDKCMTLRDVAAQSHVALSYISEVERGVKEPSHAILTVLSDTVGITLSQLYLNYARELHRNGL